MTGAGDRHGPVAQLLIAWSPLSGILVAYAVAQWINTPLADGGATNRLGFGLHVAGPPHADSAVFGVVPSVWLQQHLVDGSTHWYDAVAALVYATHFFSIPLLTGVAWFRMRDRFAAWLTAVLTFTVVGVSGYVLYPAAPPWLASEQDQIGTVDRISRFGWHFLELDPIARLSALGQGESNPVAAMPSLHAGAALLVALFLWPVVGNGWRAALLLYVALMALTLVYTGEHYAVDVVAGWATAGIAVTVGARSNRRRPRSPRPAPAARGSAPMARS
ncbi:phosphatase PAP2 family protein [Nocardioides conyzicola]|uniref:Phosphatase PAP2 family protein n=1 Tax=Nocardioides conyzicola TaxID=1651781 RepID=A0ABP8WMI8_9ACTN